MPEPQRKMYEAGAAERFGEQILSTVSAPGGGEKIGKLEHMEMMKPPTFIRCSSRLCGRWATTRRRC